MNELRNQWSSELAWHAVFDFGDLMVVESLVRQVVSNGFKWEPSETEATALLLLAKATRLEHVALPLGAPELEEQLRQDLWGDDESVHPMPDAKSIIEVFLDTKEWHAFLCDTIPVEIEVPTSGRPIVLVDSDDSSSRFAYLRRLAYAEDQVALEIADSVATQSDAFTNRGFLPDKVIANLTKNTFGFQMNDSVSRAVNTLLTRRISVLTGGPGTGKTFTVSTILAALQVESIAMQQTLRVACCAPTAKAAVRMTEAIDAVFQGVPQSSNFGITFDSRSGSVQRLLRMHENTSTSNRDLDVDLLIVDEVSMLDLGLLEQLLVSINPETHVLLVGDPNQLISVRVGAILRDIVDLGAPGGPTSSIVTQLTIPHRFGGSIDALARAINVGDIDEVKQALVDYPDELSLVKSASALEERVMTWARELVDVANGTDPSAGIAILKKLSVLCGTRLGHGSVAWWTKHISMNLVAEGVIGIDQRIPIGAPIMVTKNEVRAGISDSDTLSNGDVGLAVRTERGVEVVFGPASKPRIRKSSDIEHFELGWSLTIHKSQGSDYDEVIVSLPDSKSSFVSRELLYTAVTRAKAKVTIIGTLEDIERAIKVRVNRVGGLRSRLEAKISGH